MNRQLALRLSPVVAFYQVDIDEAQEVLIEWRHPLHLPDEEHPRGRPYTRPYGRMAFIMEDRGRRAAAVVLASTINASVFKERGWHRYNTVDLARIARSPDRRDQQCLRAVLRFPVKCFCSAAPASRALRRAGLSASAGARIRSDERDNEWSGQPASPTSGPAGSVPQLPPPGRPASSCRPRELAGNRSRRRLTRR